MLKLLIVDDESRTRLGLRTCVPWSAYGIGELREADDGNTALEILPAFRPDIILSDIRMPNMTGLELARQVQNQLPRCKIIFISGYSDTAYLKAAIRLKAVSYIEKPIDIIELQECLRTVADTCRLEAEQARREAIRSAKLAASVVLLKQDVAAQLAEPHSHPDNLKQLLDASGLDLPVHASYVSVLFHIGSTADAAAEDSSEIRDGLYESICQSYGRERLSYIAGFKGGSHILAHIAISPSCNKYKLYEITERIIRNYLQQAGLAAGKLLFAGIGREVKGLDAIRNSYETALLAVRKALFLGNRQVLQYQETETAPASFDGCLEEQFADLVMKCDPSVFDFIETLIRDIRADIRIPIEQIKTLFYRLLLKLYSEAKNKYLGRYIGERKDEALWFRISDAATLHELAGFLKSEMREYLRAIRDKHSLSRIVHETIRYIQDNYRDGNFTINDIANELNLTPAYLSQLFKRDTGKTINIYRTEYKIEKAKELLTNREATLLEIASETGFNDAKYFTKTFKRITGITPSEYRENFLK